LSGADDAGGEDTKLGKLRVAIGVFDVERQLESLRSNWSELVRRCPETIFAISVGLVLQQLRPSRLRGNFIELGENVLSGHLAIRVGQYSFDKCVIDSHLHGFMERRYQHQLIH
jgi:hypothetical protein